MRGKRHTSPKWRSFDEARAFVRSKELTNVREWKTFCRSGGKPDDIPATPEGVYKAEWRGFGDWLGTGAVAPKDRQFRSFQAARALVRSKGLTSRADWTRYCRSGEKPDDIPAASDQTYKAEWRGFGDWLGTGAVATRDRQFQSFQAARAFVRSKGLTNQAEWRTFCRSGGKPDDIPATPEGVYKAEWRGFGDWLGTGAVATRDRQFQSFQAARAFVRSKGLTSQAEWTSYCRSGGKPDDIPATPAGVYKAEWRGWRDWFGTEFRSFQAARAFVRSKGLTNRADWTRYCRSGEKPDDIPVTPERVYKAEWRGTGDWLGTEYRSFQAARAFVRSKGLTNLREWKTFCRSGGKPDDIPAHPERVYKAEWRGMGDWLGTGAVAPRYRQYRSFQAARAFVRSKGLTRRADWTRYCRSGEKPDDIPATPDQVYKAEWRGMGDWLGTGAVAPQDRQYRSFQAARAFVRSKGLTKLREWKTFCRSGGKPDDIPAHPELVYKAEWRGMGDWLGTGAVAAR